MEEGMLYEAVPLASRIDFFIFIYSGQLWPRLLNL